MSGVRGTTVAVARLNRDREHLFKPAVTIEKINSLNNFKFTEDGHVRVHRQYEIGPGKVSIGKTKILDKCVPTGVQFRRHKGHFNRNGC